MGRQAITLPGRVGGSTADVHDILARVTAVTPTIFAASMGFNRAGTPWCPSPGFAYAFALAGTEKGPKLCFVANASGDQRANIENFYAAFAGTSVVCSHLALFDKPNVADARRHLLAQDVVWVDRGSVANLVALWRLHGIDEVLRECWRAGVVMAGESAGSLCWHSGGTTDSFGEVRGWTDGVGFLPYSNAVHYRERRALFQELIGKGELPDGYATDAGAGLLYRGTELVEAVSDRKNAGAYRVTRNPDGGVTEVRLDVRRL